MMMRSLLLLVLAVSTTAFTVPSARWGVTSSTSSLQNMFAPDPDAKPLEVASEGESLAVEASIASIDSSAVASPTMTIKNLARGGEVKEVRFIDPAMTANTNPLEMNWWAYLLFGFPFVLLANDFLHFLPKEGPLSFLSNY